METLSPERARALLGKAPADLKTVRERLGQNPSNSSRPPSTRAPWEQADGGKDQAPEATTSSPGADDGEESSEEPQRAEVATQARQIPHIALSGLYN